MLGAPPQIPSFPPSFCPFSPALKILVKKKKGKRNGEIEEFARRLPAMFLVKSSRFVKATLRVIHLHGAHVSTANESLGKKNALSIQTPNRLFHLIAPTLVECEEWIDLVKNAILLLSERKEVAQDGAALQETLSLTKLPDFEYLAANHSKTVHLKYPANQLDVFALLKDSKSLNAQQCDISYQKPEII